MKKHLGIDWGQKRLGLALSDADAAIAFPLETVDARRPDLAIEAIQAVIDREDVGTVVVGLPLNLDGTEGRAAKLSTRFADRLARAIAPPVERWDERFTTQAAARALTEGGRTAAQQRSVVDQLSAALLLQSYLDARRDGDPGGA